LAEPYLRHNRKQGKNTITLFLIFSLLSSVLSVALTSSEQLNQSFGEKPKGDKPKDAKSDSKSKKVDKSKGKAKPKEEDKSKEYTKSKDDDTKPKDDDKTKGSDDIKQDDPSTPPPTDTLY
jgi:hypothetical protein